MNKKWIRLCYAVTILYDPNKTISLSFYLDMIGLYETDWMIHDKDRIKFK